MRLDVLLHRLRFARSRARAQGWIGEGHIRLNGERVTRNDRAIAPGDVLTLPLAARVLVMELEALPQRRGPPAEARGHYRELDARPSVPIAGETPPGPAAQAGPARRRTMPQ